MSLWAKLRGKPNAGGKRAAAMQRIQWALGIAVTAIVAIIWWNGWLDGPELGTIDFRAKHFASANATPSDRIVVVAIDDAAIDNVGRWPWHREKLAAVIDELTAAGVSVVALDILLDDPQEPRPVQVSGGVAGGGPSTGELRLIHDDTLLGEAIKRHGRVVSAVNFNFNNAGTQSNVLRASMPQLYALMDKEPTFAGRPWPEIERQVLQSLPAFKDLPFTRGKEIDKLRLRWEAAVTLKSRAADSSISTITPAPPWAVSTEPGVPVKPIADASRRLANVTFDSYDSDGLTRRIPLLVQHNGRLWPTLGLAAATEFLTGSDKDLRATPDTIGFNTSDGKSRVLEVRTQRVDTKTIAGMHMVSWPRAISGGDIPATERAWQRQFYDVNSRRPAEVPIGRLYEPARIAIAVSENWANIRAAVNTVFKPAGLLDGDRLTTWTAADTALTSSAVGSPAWNAAIAQVRPVIKSLSDDAQVLIELTLGGPKSKNLDKYEKLSKQEKDVVDNLTDALEAIPRAGEAIDQGVKKIAELRAEIKQRLAGTICFVGWTATGSLADFVATSVDPRTPGVHVHAAVCNSILTGFQRVPGPVGDQLMVIVALGLVGTWIGVRSSVVGGPLLVIAVLLLWIAFASIVLWGMYDVIWVVATPSIAASGGWLVVVLHRLLVEQRSRRKTEERFKSYVSPAVVDILVQNPSLNSMAPQQRELTVLFTDIAGFTTTAERLGSQGTAELLAVYLGTMTEVVQRHGATLDKYIGDAIMAFWGAPIDDVEHARHACTAAVEMMNTLDKLNESKAFGKDVDLFTRIGLATGDLMVGDFGNPPRNSSYTVIGDTANLGSRLEGANKVFGTRTLVSDRTRQLAGPGFLWRYVGTIKVKGKHKGIPVHELLPGKVKGEQTDDWIALSEALIADYQAERFEQALAKAIQLREIYHDEVFASAYGDAIVARQAGLVEGDFDGSITLTDK